MAGQWELRRDQRDEVVHRLTANIASLAFAQGVSMRLGDAESAAETAEKKAYTVASVESRTTSGQRPHAESLRAYTRQVPTAHPSTPSPPSPPASKCIFIPIEILRLRTERQPALKPTSSKEIASKQKIWNPTDLPTRLPTCPQEAGESRAGHCDSNRGGCCQRWPRQRRCPGGRGQCSHCARSQRDSRVFDP